MDFIDKVSKLDSIHTVFILSHNPVWSDAEESLRAYELIGNAPAGWIPFLCKWATQFRHLYHGPLVDLQSSGKQVHCIAGDGGQYAKTFYETGGSGIKYYVTGINNSVLRNADEATIEKFNTEADSILIFTYQREDNSFSGEFIPLDKL